MKKLIAFAVLAAFALLSPVSVRAEEKKAAKGHKTEKKKVEKKKDEKKKDAKKPGKKVEKKKKGTEE